MPIIKDKIIDGKSLSNTIAENLKKEIQQICSNEKINTPPNLAIILIGEDPASELYVKAKANISKDLGIETSVYKIPSETNEKDILFLIDTLNKDETINGIIVQLPLPEKFNTDKILSKIDPAKDVDGEVEKSSFTPATAIAAMTILKEVFSEIDDVIKNKSAVVIGDSKIVGKPIHNLLLEEKVKSINVNTNNSVDEIKKLCQQSDIIVSATGQAEMIKSDWVKEDAIIIDIGITKIGTNEKTGKSILRGDVAINEVKDKVCAITPVIGGIGPMTIIMLMQNTIKAFKEQNKIK